MESSQDVNLFNSSNPRLRPSRAPAQGLATFQESRTFGLSCSGEFIPRPPYGKYALDFPEPVICSRLRGLTFPSTNVLLIFFFCLCPLLLSDNLGCTNWLESTTEVCTWTYGCTRVHSPLHRESLRPFCLAVSCGRSGLQSLSHTCHARYGTNGTRQPNTVDPRQWAPPSL